MAGSDTLKYNASTGRYYWTNADNVNIYLSATDAAQRNPTQYKELQPKIAQGAWDTTYAPQWEKYSTDMQRKLQTAYDRSYAEAQGRLGYGLATAGSGEGGIAEASRLALTTEAQNKRMDIAAQRDTMLQQAYIQFMTTKDAQAFELAKMGAQYEYNQKIAEMNQPSWWQSLASIAGTVIGLFTGKNNNNNTGSYGYSSGNYGTYSGSNYMEGV